MRLALKPAIRPSISASSGGGLVSGGTPIPADYVALKQPDGTPILQPDGSPIYTPPP